DLGLGGALQEKVVNPFFGQINLGPLSDDTVQRAQMLRPYPQFGHVTSTSAGWSNSRYHALQVKMEKRFARDLAVGASYTWSKLMDDSSGNLIGGELFAPGTTQDWNNLRSEWATSVLDQTHRLVWNAIYALPWWKRWRGVPGRLLGGW